MSDNGYIGAANPNDDNQQDEIPDRMYIDIKALHQQAYIAMQMAGAYRELLGNLQGILFYHDIVPEQTIANLKRVLAEQPYFENLMTLPDWLSDA